MSSEGESGALTDKCYMQGSGNTPFFPDNSTSSKYPHQQNGDRLLMRVLEYLDQKQDDASSVDSLNDSHSDEDDDDDDDDDDYDTDDEEQERRIASAMTTLGVFWNPCNLPQDNRSVKMQQLLSYEPLELPDDEKYTLDIYCYYRKDKGYGGYGIVIKRTRNTIKRREPETVGVSYGSSQGGSYLYHLLVGMKRGFEIAAGWNIPRVEWSINSRRAANYFNSNFRDPSMLTGFFHTKHDIVSVKFCQKCLRNWMCLLPASFELLVPAIEEFIKVQFSTGFRYMGSCSVGRSESAYRLAKFGSEALEENMRRGGSDKIEESWSMGSLSKKIQDQEVDKNIEIQEIDKIQEIQDKIN